MDSEKKVSKIYTHKSIDPDACFSVLGIIKYKFGQSFSEFFKNPKWKSLIIFKDANWNGDGMGENDIAVDLFAGGKGIKGVVDEGNRIDSATLEILEKFAPHYDQRALENLVCYLNEKDATGDAIESLLPDSDKSRDDFKRIFKMASLDGIFRAVQLAFQYDDYKVIQHFSWVFDGMLIQGKKQLKSAEEYSKRAKVHGKKNNIVFLNMNEAPLSLCDLAFEKGAEIVIYQNGNDIGIKRRNFSKFPVDHPLILKVIERAGETGQWFIHPAKFLICRGSNKARAKSKSTVRPDQLIYAVTKVLG